MTNKPHLIQLAETLLAMSYEDRETVLDLVNGPDSPLRREYKVVIAPLEVLQAKNAAPASVVLAIQDAMCLDKHSAQCIVNGEEAKGNRMSYTNSHANALAINCLWRQYCLAWPGTPEEGFMPATVEVWE